MTDKVQIREDPILQFARMLTIRAEPGVRSIMDTRFEIFLGTEWKMTVVIVNLPMRAVFAYLDYN